MEVQVVGVVGDGEKRNRVIEAVGVKIYDQSINSSFRSCLIT